MPFGTSNFIASQDEKVNTAEHALFKQQIPTVLELITRIPIVKPRKPLLFQGQGEAQTTRINPTVTDLGQSPYSVQGTQGICDLVQGLERTSDKTVTLLHQGDGLLAGSTFDPFVTVEQNLNTKRGMPTHLDRHMPPFFVDKVKMIMVYIGPGPLPLQMRNPILTRSDFPYQRRGLGYQDQEKSLKLRIAGPMLLGQLVFAHPRLTMEERNTLLFGIRMDPATEASSHPLQMFLIEALVGIGQLSPPVAKPAALLAQGKIAVEHNPVHTVITSFQKLFVVLGEIVIFHQASPHPRYSRGEARWEDSYFKLPRRGHFSCAKSREKRRILRERKEEAEAMGKKEGSYFYGPG